MKNTSIPKIKHHPAISNSPKQTKISMKSPHPYTENPPQNKPKIKIEFTPIRLSTKSHQIQKSKTPSETQLTLRTQNSSTQLQNPQNQTKKIFHTHTVLGNFLYKQTQIKL
jgi:hypothetical protein